MLSVVAYHLGTPTTLSQAYSTYEVENKAATVSQGWPNRLPSRPGRGARRQTNPCPGRTEPLFLKPVSRPRLGYGQASLTREEVRRSPSVINLFRALHGPLASEKLAQGSTSEPRFTLSLTP